MEYLIIAAVSVWAVEVFLRLPVRQAVNDLWLVSRKALHVVSSKRISDHWKEKVMLVYARQSFLNTLRIAGLLLVFLFLILIPIAVVDHFNLTEQPMLELFASTQGLIASTIMAACYFWVRGRFVK